MASGFFPLDKWDRHYEELKLISARLDMIANDKILLSAEQCTPEDAATDGAYIERLRIAAEFIRYTLENDSTDRP